jgi:hypothetical protein
LEGVASYCSLGKEVEQGLVDFVGVGPSDVVWFALPIRLGIELLGSLDLRGFNRTVISGSTTASSDHELVVLPVEIGHLFLARLPAGGGDLGQLYEERLTRRARDTQPGTKSTTSDHKRAATKPSAWQVQDSGA